MFVRDGKAPKLIGGLAVVAHQVVCATRDVDFLAEAEAADRAHDALLDLGYQCTASLRAACWRMHRSETPLWAVCASSASEG